MECSSALMSLLVWFSFFFFLCYFTYVKWRKGFSDLWNQTLWLLTPLITSVYNHWVQPGKHKRVWRGLKWSWVIHTPTSPILCCRCCHRPMFLRANLSLSGQASDQQNLSNNIVYKNVNIYIKKYEVKIEHNEIKLTSIIHFVSFSFCVFVNVSCKRWEQGVLDT